MQAGSACKLRQHSSGATRPTFQRLQPGVPRLPLLILNVGARWVVHALLHRVRRTGRQGAGKASACDAARRSCGMQGQAAQPGHPHTTSAHSTCECTCPSLSPDPRTSSSFCRWNGSMGTPTSLRASSGWSPGSCACKRSGQVSMGCRRAAGCNVVCSSCHPGPAAPAPAAHSPVQPGPAAGSAAAPAGHGRSPDQLQTGGRSARRLRGRGGGRHCWSQWRWPRRCIRLSLCGSVGCTRAITAGWVGPDGRARKHERLHIRPRRARDLLVDGIGCGVGWGGGEARQVLRAAGPALAGSSRCSRE